MLYQKETFLSDYLDDNTLYANVNTMDKVNKELKK